MRGIVAGKALPERLGRNDPRPWGSGRRVETLLQARLPR